MGKRKREAIGESGEAKAYSLKKLFVTNLPFSFTDSQLEEVFSEVGPVRRCFMVKPKGADHNPGYGFVQFATADDAKRAIESKNGLVISGRKIKVDHAKNRSSSEQIQKKRENAGKENKGNQKDVAAIGNESGENTNEKIKLKAERKKSHKGLNEEKSLNKSKKDGAKLPKDNAKKSAGQRVARTVVFGGLVDKEMRVAVLVKARNVGAIESITDPLPEYEFQGHGLARDGCKIGAVSVVYESVQSACKAVVTLHNQSVGNGVVWARQLGGEGSKVRKWRLIIRNLPFEVSDKELRATFATAGFVWDITLPGATDKSQPKGFAFVSFTCKKDAEKAVSSINGTKIGKRIVAVDWAIQKKKYETATAPTNTSDAGMSISDLEDEDTASESEDDPDIDISPRPDIAQHNNTEENSDISKELDIARKVVSSIFQSEENMEVSGADEHNKSESGNVEQKSNKATIQKNSNEKETVKSGKPTLVEIPAKSEAEKENKLERTVFVSNIPFDIDDEEIKSKFSNFGKIKSVHCVLHHLTKRPKGTAFIEFKDQDGADAAISAAKVKPSSLDSGIMLKGRSLNVLKAVDKENASKIEKVKTMKKDNDHRNLYLTKEGLILDGTPAAAGVSAEDLSKRQLLAQKKAIKLRSPNFHVSKTRLVVDNVPKSMTEKDLKKLFIDAVKLRATKQNPSIKQVKILNEIKKSSNVPGGQSRGVAYVEFTEHEHALVALRVLNNNPETFTPDRRPIVEFAVEDIRKLQQLKENSRNSFNHVNATKSTREFSHRKIDSDINEKPRRNQREEDSEKPENDKRNDVKKKRENPKKRGKLRGKENAKEVKPSSSQDPVDKSETILQRAKPSSHAQTQVQHQNRTLTIKQGVVDVPAQVKGGKRKPVERLEDQSRAASDQRSMDGKRVKRKKTSGKEIEDDVDRLVARYRTRLFSENVHQASDKSKQTGGALRRWFE